MSNTSRIFLDIESLPSIHADADTWPCKLPAEPTRGKVPASYKKPETIAKKEADIEARYAADVAAYDGECAAVRTEAYERGSMHPLQARVLCIGYAFDDEPTETMYADYWDGCPHDDVEGALLMWFARIVKERRPHTWVGHNVAFDLTMLRLRAERYGVGGLLTDMPWTKRESWERVHCTYEHSQSQMRWKGAKLDALARYFGIQGKPEGFGGAEVYGAWLRGEHERIAEYCAGDVDMTRAIAKRQRGW